MWKLVTLEHCRPRVVISEHTRLTSRLDSFAERPARVDRSVETNGTEERAKEELRVWMALEPKERDPRLGLLERQRVFLETMLSCDAAVVIAEDEISYVILSLLESVVSEEIWDHHLRVSDSSAETQVARDGETSVSISVGASSPDSSTGGPAADLLAPTEDDEERK